MRICVVFGTRPEIIKLGPVIRALKTQNGVHLDVFATGQHIDLAAGLLELFEIDVTYEARSVLAERGLAGKFGLVAQQLDHFLAHNSYDWVVVQGDTATAAAAASAAFMHRVPVAHVEAGLRTGNLYSPWPEEFNRRVITVASFLHFPPTIAAQHNLLKEGVPIGRAPVVGNTVVDALLYTREKVCRGYVPLDPELAHVPSNTKLILSTLHRRENIGVPLRRVLQALAELGRDGDKTIVLPVHFNPEVRSEVTRVLRDAPNVHLVAPLQYTDFVYLLGRAWAVVSDSGGVQEEAPTFGLPILITRDTTERPEVVEAGFGRLVGADVRVIVQGVRELTAGNTRQLVLKDNPFGRGDTAPRIAAFLMAGDTRRRSVRWQS